MIFPFPKGLMQFFKSPVTLLLILVNLAAFMFFSQSSNFATEAMEDKAFIKTQGELFSQYILAHTENYSDRKIKVANLVKLGKPKQTAILGRLAIVDPEFNQNALNYNFTGDQVAQGLWRTKFEALQSSRKVNATDKFGFNTLNYSLTKLVTYQFFHASFAHFMGNMIFLFMFGVMLEKLIGSLALMTVYMISGFMAAATFLYFADSGLAPLVGSSGAISGLVGLYAYQFWNKKVRFVYCLFIPKLDYMGYMYLPGYVLFVLWFSADLAGFLGTLGEFGGVAHSAHLGGQVTGILVGLILSAVGRSKKERENCADQLSHKDQLWIQPASQL